MKFSLIHPSRSRPQQAIETAQEWLRKAGKVDVEWILSLDTSDPALMQYQLELSHYSIYKLAVNNNTSVVEATNNACKHATGDVLIYLSDDFKCPDNWGELLEIEFKDENRPLLLKVDDCLQRFEVPVLTIPIMNRKLYERLGYFWYPEYKSMFVDEDLYWTVQKLGAMKNAKHLKFEHCHVSNGKAPNDETYIRSAANWDQGKKLFAERKSKGFPI